jgi:hypothetical protein
MAIQQTQILEVKANRLEAELETMRALYGGPPSHAHVHQQYGQAPASARPPTHGDAPSHPNRPPSQPPPPIHRSQPPPAHRSQPPPAGAQASAGLRLGRDLHREQYVAEDSSADDIKNETVVVRREDVLAAHQAQPQVPFQITPPGAPPPPSASIPGAPWARDRGPRVQVPIEEYTIDAPSLRADSSSDLDGDTYATPAKARTRTTPSMSDDDVADTAIKRGAKR